MSDILTRIEQLKRDRNAVILTHYYQDPDIQDVAGSFWYLLFPFYVKKRENSVRAI